MATDSAEQLKRAAAAEAVTRVESGMRLGIGSGSTVAHFIELLGARVRGGALRDLVGVPTSVETADRAHAAGISLGALHELAPLDLTVDGADEIDPDLELIKGLGGAHLREKMVVVASERFLVIADAAKLVTRLGTRAPLPVEVATFAWQVHVPFLRSLGGEPALRVQADGSPYVTDNGNYVVDCRFEGGLPDPEDLEGRLLRRPGIVETGLFVGLATEAAVADEGGVRWLARSRGAGEAGREAAG